MKTPNQNTTPEDVITAMQAYLQVLQQKPYENLGLFLYRLYDSQYADEGIEQTSIDIGIAMAAFCNTNVHKVLVEYWGEYAMERFTKFLANLNKVLLYAANCEATMVSARLAHWEESDCERVSEATLQRIKKEFEIKLQRLQDGQDFD